ncbi:methyltransferase-like protein 2 isoform X2 [Andrographis paniculata]|uniref:methyltransferase-like protein 2 isoform X2 n=1 Tax=Andrographis paniculata TaxID=175694 RepID=UPI0021E96FC6|nr:methyltransferase-like protein 2 isoform X2 [Andrographis paniculata]
MAGGESDRRLSDFTETGIYHFDDAGAFFVDSVRVLNRFYTRFRVSPSAYYSRFFPAADNGNNPPRKRKRGGKEINTPQNLNSREKIAEQRHQEARRVLLKAHEAFLGAGQLLQVLPHLRNDTEERNGESFPRKNEINFVELGSVWQAPFYEISFKDEDGNRSAETAGDESRRVARVFGNFVANEGSDDIEAEFLGHEYILPKESCFYMSDLRQIHNLIPAESDNGFNLIVIDPPWENSSAHQKQIYQTLPNRYFLSLPIKQLTHTDGALIVLWVTNREKLRSFVENELFPKWGVERIATFYWLKVKPHGSMISELDLFHHKPYECLLLGFSRGKEMNSEMGVDRIPDNQVVVSIPGSYSRKPPIGEVLLDYYVPELRRGRRVELFGREMMGGWTSWGNEPLHFQDSIYFVRKT